MSTKQNPDVSAATAALVEKYDLEQVVLALCGRAPSFTAVKVSSPTQAVGEGKRATAAQTAVDTAIARIRLIESTLAVPMKACQDTAKEVEKQRFEALLMADGDSGRAVFQAMRSARSKGLDWFQAGNALHAVFGCKTPFGELASYFAQKYDETVPE